MSKNFRNQLQQHREQQQAKCLDSSQTVDASAIDLGSVNSLGECVGGHSSACSPRKLASRSNSATLLNTTSNEKVPMEYLMYHHFGAGTFQRAGRRPSDTDAAASWSNADSADELGHGSASSNASSHKGSPVARGRSKQHSKVAKTIRANSDSDQSVGELVASGQHSSSKSQLEGQKLAKLQLATKRHHQNQSSLSNTGQQQHNQAASIKSRFKRQGSVNLNIQFLSSLPNDRQKLSYVQSVYRSYFEQMNAHNLWLFAQSFVKRKTLKLRKDCGAAAHAAAAAASLGTSVSLMRLQDRATDHQHHTQSSQLQSEPTQATNHSDIDIMTSTSKNQQHQVAGTKVKKTLACQTLIMCSNVQIHSDRAFKMMSMLNPLQASCIKSDHLLVLEERPDKVCQALRLFLQGIGYSMSTYERRLKLSSMQAGAGSNDSRDSITSFN